MTLRWILNLDLDFAHGDGTIPAAYEGHSETLLWGCRHITTCLLRSGEVWLLISYAKLASCVFCISHVATEHFSQAPDFTATEPTQVAGETGKVKFS